MPDLTVALAGNPNAGKSTIFNALTGLRQHTGNWPGKTVEKKIGKRNFGAATIEFVDLPGTYSLSAYSPDEIVARDYIISAQPDAVICVIDATNLERNLYLVVQTIELGVPVVVALNMIDQAQALGIDIDQNELSQLLGGVPVVPTVASRRQGLDQLLAITCECATSHCSRRTGRKARGHCRCHHRTGAVFQVNYGQEIETALADLSSAAEINHLPLNGYCPRWLSLKLLEQDEAIVKDVRELPGGAEVCAFAQEQANSLMNFFGDDLDIITADHRYGTIRDISRQVNQRKAEDARSLTDRIDRFATNRLLGLPLFLLVMYLIFRLVIDVSTPYLDWVDQIINVSIAGGLASLLTTLGAPLWFHSLVIDGIVAGVGGILTFVPGLIALFFFLALLEDSGYLARAAFVMDRFMQQIGLHGKSVIPLMLGFGCAVPAIYATRTIASRRDRLLTALLIPFMSCSARLPVYVVFALAFFGAQAGTVIWLMYLLGIVVAILIGAVLSRTVLKPHEQTAFVMELPPYRLPTLKALGLHTWGNTSEFVKRAGTVILAISVVLWLLLNLPWGVTDQRDSYYGQLSSAITPALEPTGFGSYETSGALITGFIAKEMVVSTLAQIYVGEAGDQNLAETPDNSLGSQLVQIIKGFFLATIDALKTLVSIIPGINLVGDGAVEDTTLSQALRLNFTPLSAFAFLVFVLLYVPCMATIGAIKQEFGGRWATSAAVYQTVIAWLAAVLIFQVGRLLGFG